MISLPEVEVLLATYNGERFLREQLDSIFAQDYGNVRVLARDDGSGDRTVDILNEYAERFPGRLRLMPPSPPTGSPKNNFLLLMKASNADYVCFSDQDDVWLPDKVSRTRKAMDQLELRWGKKVPLLVFTDLALVDENLRMIHESFWTCLHIIPERINRRAQLMVHSVVTGSTAMLNRPLLDLSLRMSEDAYMHDGWVSWVASYMGKSSIIKTQTVLYRQHDRNVLGAGKSLDGTEVTPPNRSLWEKIRHPRIAAGHVLVWDLSQRHARAFLKEYDKELSRSERKLLEAFLQCQTSRSPFVRVATLVSHGFFYVGLKPNLALMIYLWRMNVDERH